MAADRATFCWIALRLFLVLETEVARCGPPTTSLHLAAEDGVKEAVRSSAEAADGSVDGKNDAQTALQLAVRGGL